MVTFDWFDCIMSPVWILLSVIQNSLCILTLAYYLSKKNCGSDLYSKISCWKQTRTVRLMIHHYATYRFIPDRILTRTQVLWSFCCTHGTGSSDRLDKKSTTLIVKHMEAVLGESINNRIARASTQTDVAAALVSMGDYATECLSD